MGTCDADGKFCLNLMPAKPNYPLIGAHLARWDFRDSSACIRHGSYPCARLQREANSDQDQALAGRRNPKEECDLLVAFTTPS